MRDFYLLGYCWILLLFTTSCSKSTVESFPSVSMELGIASFDSEGRVDSLFLDRGDLLSVIKKEMGKVPVFPALSYARVLTYLETKTEGEAILYDMVQIPIIEPNSSELHPTDLRKDPISLVRIWLGGGFLNMEYGVKAVDLSLHDFLFTENIVEVGDNAMEAHLVMYHNRGGDIEGSTKKHIVSFSLERYKNELETPFVLRVFIPTYSGQKEYNFTID